MFVRAIHNIIEHNRRRIGRGGNVGHSNTEKIALLNNIFHGNVPVTNENIKNSI